MIITYRFHSSHHLTHSNRIVRKDAIIRCLGVWASVFKKPKIALQNFEPIIASITYAYVPKYALSCLEVFCKTVPTNKS